MVASHAQGVIRMRAFLRPVLPARTASRDSPASLGVLVYIKEIESSCVVCSSLRWPGRSWRVLGHEGAECSECGGVDGRGT